MLLTVFVLYRYIIRPYNKIEKTLNLIFLQKDNACKVINNFHSNYFLKMEKKESKIRGCSNLDCIKYYCNKVLEFNNSEKKSIFWLVSLLKKFIQNSVPSWNNYPWNLIKISRKIEGGMPHTIYNCIILPDSITSSIATFYQKKKYNEIIEEYGLILIHEYIHVIQKLNPNIFNNLYQNYWNYSYQKVNIPNNLKNIQRINPDGLDTNWVYNKNDNSKIAHHVVLKKTNQLSDINIVTLKVNKDQSLTETKKDKEFKSFFCKNSQNYHPHENSACLISEYILFKNGYNINFNDNCKAIIKMEKWLLII